jgi:hypothetical protein
MFSPTPDPRNADARSRRSRLGYVIAGAVIGLGVAGWLLSMAVFTGPRPATIKTSRTSAMELRRVAEMWRGTHPAGECPTVEQLRQTSGIDRLVVTTDAWRNPFEIECSEDETTIRSLGPDGKPSADDIVEPKPQPR